MGFEPMIRFPVYTISSRAPSAKLGHLSSLSEYNFIKRRGDLSILNSISFHFFAIFLRCEGVAVLLRVFAV